MRFVYGLADQNPQFDFFLWSYSESASKVMVELLGTYTTENASQAREEAQRCIVASLGDPNTFLLDHLLTLQPVKGIP